MSSILTLRNATADAHKAVDAAFAGYDLTTAGSYREFLEAHARALPEAEARAAAAWKALRRRTPLLAQDLAALGAPTALPIMTGDVAGPAQWGALYVVEGSRLGGGLLAGRVGEGLPHAYLSATHAPGEWRAIRAAIDAAGEGRDTAWHEAMVAGALDVFALYEAAAR